MNGFARTFYAVSAAVLGLLSHVFIFPAERLQGAAAWCHERSLRRETEA